MAAVLMMSPKLVTLGFLKLKKFWSKVYDVIIFIYEVTNKILSRNSNYILDVVMWSKFVKSSSSMTEVHTWHFCDHNLSFIQIWQEKIIFCGVFLVQVQ